MRYDVFRVCWQAAWCIIEYYVRKEENLLLLVQPCSLAVVVVVEWQARFVLW